VLIHSQRETEATPDWQHHYDLGMRFLSQGNYQEAVIAFRAAIEINPRQAEAYLGLADAYVGLGNIDGAIAVLREGYSLIGDTRLRERIAELENIGVVVENNSAIEPQIEIEEDAQEDTPQDDQVFVPTSIEFLLHPNMHSPDGVPGRWTFEYDSNGFIVRIVQYSRASGLGRMLDILVPSRERIFEYDDATQNWWHTSVGIGGYFDDSDVWHDFGRTYSEPDLESARLPIHSNRPLNINGKVVDAFPEWSLRHTDESLGEGGRMENRHFDSSAGGTEWAYAIYQFDELGNAIFITTFGGNGNIIGEAWIEWGVLE